MMTLSSFEQNEQERRQSEARHEYNNIAAIVLLSRNPLILAQVRKLWDEFRSKYPDYIDDPDGVADVLGTNSSPSPE